jgi:ribosome biogenesis GTPase A
MRKARRAIAEAMPSQDVVIEVLDARMPRASENPVVTELRGPKPCVKVLTKSDLADPDVTRAWLEYLERRVDGPGAHPAGKVVALAVTTDRASDARTRITEACGALAVPTRGRTTARAMIIGIPNVGKSTLVNTLAQRKVANVGDEPAVTKSEQVVKMKNGMMLSDNPGILWPKIEDPTAALRLALGGAIPDAALDYEGVALFGAGVFLGRYPELLAKRYKLTTMPADAEALLLEVGRRRGCLRSGGTIDRHKAADVLIHDFRDGALGRISLERPEE